MRRRASDKDHQSELRTKVNDEEFDTVREMAAEAGVTMYEMTRRLIRYGIAWTLLIAEGGATRSVATGTQNLDPVQILGQDL